MNEGIAAETITFDFEIQLGDETDAPIAFTVNLAKDTLDALRVDGPLPNWARLEYHQCPGCPLRAGEEYCPAAASLSDVIGHFERSMSYDEATVTVRTKERSVTTRTNAQSALRSVLGLVLATSGCPVLAKFKPMARFHLPFANRDETIYRAAAAYLLAQYRLKQLHLPHEFSLAGLQKFYGQVSRVNQCLANRIRGTSPGDANLNAITLLDVLAQELNYSLDDKLGELDYLFRAYISG